MHICSVQRAQDKMATVTEIIVGMPSDIEQARRCLSSGNLNTLEHWHARLERTLQVLTVLMQRIEEDLGQNEVFRSLCTLDEEAFLLYSEMNELLFGTLFNDERNGGYTQQPSAEESTKGRPRLGVTKENMMREYDVFRSWKVVARRLGVSVKTLRRRRVEFWMELSDVIGPRNTFTTISFQELCDTIKSALNTLPDAFGTHFHCHLLFLAFLSNLIMAESINQDVVSSLLQKSLSAYSFTEKAQIVESCWPKPELPISQNCRSGIVRYFMPETYERIKLILTKMCGLAKGLLICLIFLKA